MYLAGSIAQGPLSPHLNLGYTFSRESKAAKDPNSFVIAPADEFNYAVGVDVATTPRFTIVGDVVGRSTWDVGHWFRRRT